MKPAPMTTRRVPGVIDARRARASSTVRSDVPSAASGPGTVSRRGRSPVAATSPRQPSTSPSSSVTVRAAEVGAGDGCAEPPPDVLGRARHPELQAPARSGSACRASFDSGGRL